MTNEALELTIEPDGVLRLRATGATALELRLSSASRVGPTLKVQLDGTARGLPDGTACQVRCKPAQDGVAAFTGSANLSVPGWEPARSQPASLTFDLPIVQAGLFGRGEASLEVVPEFPGAATALVPGLSYHHPFDLEVSDASSLLVGQPIVFQPRVDADVFADVQLRVAITDREPDAAHQDPPTEPLHLSWGAGGAPPLDAPRTWLVGCNEGGTLDAFDAGTDGRLELWSQVQASVDGTSWVNAGPPTRLGTAPRPKLTSFELEYESDLSLIVDRHWRVSAEAARRKVAGAHPLTYSRVYLRGTIDSLAPELKATVALTLWRHAPAAQGDEGDLRLMTSLQDLTGNLEGGVFRAFLFDGAAREEAELRHMLPPAELFGVLDFPAGAGRQLPLSRVLDYEPAVFRPFGDRDHPRVAPKQKPEDVAISACTRGVVDRTMALAPALRPPTSLVLGDELAVRVALLGSEPAYWQAAAPCLELRVAGEDAWQDAAAKASEDGAWLEARFPMSGRAWAGHGKDVTFRARVANEDVRLHGSRVAAPDPETADLACRPAVLSVDEPTRTTHGGKPALAIRARTQYVPTKGSKKALAVALRGADGKDVPATVHYAIREGNDGLCDPADGALVAYVTGEKALAAAAAGGTKVVVFRPHERGTVHGLAVEPAERAVPPA